MQALRRGDFVLAGSGGEHFGAGYTVMTFNLSRWPGGLQPVWTLLDGHSAEALRAQPSAGNSALRLAPDLEAAALEDSVLVRNALILLEQAGSRNDVLWISPSSGCLKMKCVSRLRGLIAWPGLEATEQARKGKTYREQAVKELHLLRLLVEQAGLMRPGGLWFELTPLGERLLHPGRRGALQALLCRHAFWGLDLSRFLPVYFPRKLPERWPQGQIGVILWGLSEVAEDWQSADTLTGLCATVEDVSPDLPFNWASMLFVWRVLWPLCWFGLLEVQGPEQTFDVTWRKSALFDRFLSFNVGVQDNRGTGH